MDGIAVLGGVMASFLTGVAAIIGGLAAWRKAGGEADTATAREAEEAKKRERALLYYVLVLRDAIRNHRPPPPPPWPEPLVELGYGADYEWVYDHTYPNQKD